jgi:hypothetical protein
VDSGWHGSFPNGGSPRAVPGQVDHRKGRRWCAWAVLVALCVFILAGVSYAGVRRWEKVTQSGGFFNGFAQGLQRGLQEMQSGGTAANAAATDAAPQSFDSLTPARLNVALPKYQWVDGATSVAYSAKRPTVSLTVSETHIETAVDDQVGDCAFGLVVTSPTDPLTAQDHVAGLGKYYHLVGPGTYDQTVYHAAQCAADRAPSSGWSTWPSSLSVP